jgi:FAD synthetase
MIVARNQPHELEALQLVGEMIDAHTLPHLAFSFNGGKDITVVLHLLRAVLAHRGATDAKPLAGLYCVYFGVGAEFPELDAFMAEMGAVYEFELHTYKGDYKAGMTDLTSRVGVQGIFMGQRASDPDGVALQHSSPSSGVEYGWPAFTRLNPILRWPYHQVWAFLRELDLPFCCLYEQGYTSLGSTKTTMRNPKLRYALSSSSASSSSSSSAASTAAVKPVTRRRSMYANDESAQLRPSVEANLNEMAAAADADASAGSAAGGGDDHDDDDDVKDDDAVDNKVGIDGDDTQYAYHPAWVLKDGADERCGRIERKKK